MKPKTIRTTKEQLSFIGQMAETSTTDPDKSRLLYHIDIMPNHLRLNISNDSDAARVLIASSRASEIPGLFFSFFFKQFKKTRAISHVCSKAARQLAISQAASSTLALRSWTST